MTDFAKFPGLRLGIVGGGQLGRMMAVEARRLGIYTIILDPSNPAPASGLADESLQGSLYDAQALENLASKVDVLTFEIEHIDAAVLARLEQKGVRIAPSAAALALIQDKGKQKQKLADLGLAVPDFVLVSKEDVLRFKPKNYPVVQKLRTGGYDGRGVTVLRDAASKRLDGPSMFEECIDIELELAVLVARAYDGTYEVYPVVEMIFDPHAQICSSVLAPARISDAQTKEAIQLAIKAVEALQIVGITAVEMFLTKDGRILINELAPRPHNSGHWTIEGAVCNQFAQHVRAVCNLPLGDASLLRPSAMVNLLGAVGAQGEPILRGVPEALALPGFSLHWYQKSKVAPLRKMGHGTACASTVEEALALALEAQNILVVEGSDNVAH